MPLFKDRILSIAMLISASWHLALMFTVAPVFVSGDIKKNSTAISFLGAILERVTVVPEKPLSLDRTSFIHKLKQGSNVGSRPVSDALISPEILGKIPDIAIDKESFIFSREKGVLVSLYPKEKTSPFIDFKSSILAGEAKNRLVLYRPDLSRPHELPADFNSDYNVGIKFHISKEGFVERPECVFSSGSFTIDQAAIRYIRRWQFYPYYGETIAGQEAMVRLNFNAL